MGEVRVLGEGEAVVLMEETEDVRERGQGVVVLLSKVGRVSALGQGLTAGRVEGGLAREAEKECGFLSTYWMSSCCAREVLLPRAALRYSFVGHGLPGMNIEYELSHLHRGPVCWIIFTEVTVSFHVAHAFRLPNPGLKGGSTRHERAPLKSSPEPPPVFHCTASFQQSSFFETHESPVRRYPPLLCCTGGIHLSSPHESFVFIIRECKASKPTPSRVGLTLFSTGLGMVSQCRAVDKAAIVEVIFLFSTA